MNALHQRLRAAHRRLYAHRRILTMAIYAAVITVCYLAAFAVRFEFEWRAEYFRTFLFTLPILLLVRLVAVSLLRLSRERWRYLSTPDILRLSAAMAAGSVLFAPFARLLALDAVVPWSVLLLEWVFSTYLTAGLRVAYRMAYETSLHARARSDEGLRRVVVVGAGEAAQMLVREMQRFPTGYTPVGFVDDDPMKWGARLHGLEVIGAPADLAPIARAAKADEIVLAVPSAAAAELRRLVTLCEETGLPFKILPGIAEVLAGRASADLLREVRLEDLLGREPVKLEMAELAEDLAGTVVLITGAAGSIGSELARQVALHHPDRLLLLDQAETPLFFLERELREKHPEADLVPIVADIVDAPCVEAVFGEHRPARVFHAAAYKHVSMMEANVRQALRNNVIGTHTVAEAAGRHGAGRFVLISTDKAVRPSSVMGASKRLAERVVLELQERHPDTAYGAVRFGNVLGSNGSVVPIFRQQLEQGKPLTVTHPDVSRYFMTIPEAVQLVLQASLLPDLRGHVAMLEMGEPVPIVELARKLLRLSGRGSANSEAIRFTGLRPGEKLHEELLAPDEGTLETAVSKVRIVANGGPNGNRVLPRLPNWLRELEEGHCTTVLTFLTDTFPGLGAATPDRIYLSRPHMGGMERQLVQEAFDSNWVAPVGPHIDAFEQELADTVGAEHAVAVTSGTAALHLALLLSGVRQDSEVLVSTFTFAASVNPILYLGARPVFIDSERTSWNMDPLLLEEALESRARAGRLPAAVLVVHLYGQSADMDLILGVCGRHGVPVVEDAAEALGATYRGRAPGTFGKVGIYSFNGNKILTTSGGGALVTDDADLASHARKLATQARDDAPHYEHSEIGYNYRMSNVLAGIGRGQLPLLEDRVAARRRNFDHYRRALGDLPGIDFMPEASWGRHTRWLTTLTVDPSEFGVDREQVRRALETENIEARPLWKPMHRQPVFSRFEAVGGDVSEHLFERGLCLPSGSDLTRRELDRVVEVVASHGDGAAAGALASTGSAGGG